VVGGGAPASALIRVTVRVFTPAPLAAGATIALDGDAAHHLRVRRVVVGAAVMLHDGAGNIADGVLAGLGKGSALVAVDGVRTVAPLPAVHLLVPVADRERMLWLAEKATELGVSSWRAVRWRRSLSVAPRGEGDAFRAKVAARMRSALEQSGAAWLPEILPELDAVDAARGAAAGTRYLLAAGAPGMLRGTVRAPVTLALGPEGGIDGDEQAQLVAAGFELVSVAPYVLRFETAGIAALTLARAALDTKGL
jgi:16S rRNA (uracil1498-N3)-methyltransferase